MARYPSRLLSPTTTSSSRTAATGRSAAETALWKSPNTADRPASCDHPNFELNYNNSGDSDITIRVDGKAYVVIDDIEYSRQLIMLVDHSYFQRPCPVQLSQNTDIDASLFVYADRDVEVTFFYHCTADLIEQLFKVDCTDASPLLLA